MKEKGEPRRRRSGAALDVAPKDELPHLLLDAFRRVESVDALGAMVTRKDGEGFDGDAIRVLAAWTSSDHRWVAPRAPCPDGGNPTAAAWKWLVSGWVIDIAYIAKATDLSMATTQAKIELLVSNRLIFPDGEMAKVAKAMLQASIRKALGREKGKSKKAEEGQQTTTGRSPKPDAAN